MRINKFLAEQVLSRMEMQGMGHLLQFGEPVIALWKDFSTDWPDRLRALHKALCEDRGENFCKNQLGGQVILI